MKRLIKLLLFFMILSATVLQGQGKDDREKIYADKNNDSTGYPGYLKLKHAIKISPFRMVRGIIPIQYQQLITEKIGFEVIGGPTVLFDYFLYPLHEVIGYRETYGTGMFLGASVNLYTGYTEDLVGMYFSPGLLYYYRPRSVGSFKDNNGNSFNVKNDQNTIELNCMFAGNKRKRPERRGLSGIYMGLGVAFSSVLRQTDWYETPPKKFLIKTYDVGQLNATGGYTIHERFIVKESIVRPILYFGWQYGIGF